jgi:predicted RNase H-like HicB family nuclease
VKKKKDYHINIFYSEEDGGYIADIPDLESCSAFGKTPQEALEQVQIAKSAWLETARELGRPIPRPKYKPAIYQFG